MENTRRGVFFGKVADPQAEILSTKMNSITNIF